MSKSAVDIARKQRHVMLLEKVKARQALTPAEVRELSEYEAEHDQAAARASDAEDIKRVRARRAKTAERGTKGKGRAKSPAKRPLGLTAARVRKLALDFDDLAGADAHLGRRFDLVGLLAKHGELLAAWQRGRFLRNLRRAASTGMSLAEAAHDLQIAPEDLRQRIDGDIEAAEIWNEARLDASIELKTAWKEKAKEGNARAMAQVEAALRDEIAHAVLDIHNIPEERMAEIAAVNVSTLFRWRQSAGLPRNSGATTYDLPAVWGWFEQFTKQRSSGGAVVDVDPLRAQKAREKQLRNAELEGRLWPRETVLASLAARAQLLAETLSAARASELGQRCDGQPAPQIARMLEAFFGDVKRAACQLGDELNLPAAARAAWDALVGQLGTENSDGT